MKTGKCFEQTFHRRYQKEQKIPERTAKNHTKRHSKSLVIKEMQNKTTTTYHYIPTRIVEINKWTIPGMGWICEPNITFMNCWQECRMVQSLGTFL